MSISENDFEVFEDEGGRLCFSVGGKSADEVRRQVRRRGAAVVARALCEYGGGLEMTALELFADLCGWVRDFWDKGAFMSLGGHVVSKYADCEGENEIKAFIEKKGFEVKY